MNITISITAPYDILPDHPGFLIFEGVDSSLTIGALKRCIEEKSGVPIASQKLYHNGLELVNDKTLEQCDLPPGDAFLGLQVRNPQPSSSWSTRPPTGAHGTGREPAGPSRRPQPGRGAPDAEMLRLQALGSPAALAQIRSQAPALADSIHDPARFGQMFQQMVQQQQDAEAGKDRNIALLNADPFNVEAQKQIEDYIRQDQVMKNMETAMEYHPEAFGRVHMLYIPVEVNNFRVKAFVDSGAQATIMSPDCAEKCGILRLLDKRFAGLARGVGTAKILGRVHSAQIKIGSSFLPCMFTVMEGKDVDLLLGLDMLKRYQASIDLGRNALVIQGDEVPFLGEADIPKHEEEALLGEPTVDGPSGLKTGAISGAVSHPGAPGSDAGNAAASSANPSPVTTTGSITGQQQQSTPDPASVPPSDIERLTDMGFSREEAIQALTVAEGNFDTALAFLM